MFCASRPELVDVEGVQRRSESTSCMTTYNHGDLAIQEGRYTNIIDAMVHVCACQQRHTVPSGQKLKDSLFVERHDLLNAHGNTRLILTGITVTTRRMTFQCRMSQRKDLQKLAHQRTLQTIAWLLAR